MLSAYSLCSKTVDSSVSTSSSSSALITCLPSKKTVFMMTRSFYEPLTKAEVKIYEYTPGFIHSKMMVVDDNYAVVGLINLFNYF